MPQIMGGVRRVFALGVFVGGTVAVSSAAHAALILNVTETGGPTIPIADNGPLDVNLAPGVVTVNTGTLNSLLTNFSFTTLGVSSNQPTGAPGSNTPAVLSQTGSVSRSTATGSFSVTVNAVDTGYLFPSGNPKQMTTSASDTFAFTTAGDSRSFQSSFDPSNSSPPGAGTNSPLLVFIPPNGVGPFSTSNPGVTTPLGTQPTPFGINNTTVITLGASAPGSSQTDQFAGSTIVTAVPEPTGLLMLSAAAGGLAMRRRRR